VGQLRERLATARQDRDRQLRVHPSPTGQRAADRPQLRKRVRVLQARIERLERRSERLGQQVERARHVKQSRAQRAGAGRMAARKQAREHAESVLGSQISLMMALSKERAAARFTPSSGHGFMRPARGRVSQGYGCQARRRGRCLYFHDGIDIAAPSGTRVRASADGYVAFAGWNPWDQGRRSFVVIIGHARGIETIYAHLRPVRMVRAGASIRRGQTIGLVGLTGHTSGPHVHWEVSRGFHSMDPLRAGR
jgi:murein DD-endopeptidase MepM/ murein hydrolase activator NlpD